MHACCRTVLAGLTVLLLLAGCAGDPDSSGESRDRFTELPPMPEDAGAQASPTATEVPTPVIPEFVAQLLDPGATTDPPERIFFRNGRDLWQLAGDEARPTLADGVRFGPYATSPQGERVAVVILTAIDSQSAEAVHIIAEGESPGEPLLPPRVTTGQNAEPAIVGLTWSTDAAKLGIVYDDARIAIIEIAPANGGPATVVAELSLPGNIDTIEQIDWSSSGQGLAIVGREVNGPASLWVASLDGNVFEVSAASLDGRKSVSDAAWLPGRGRIAFVEELATSTGQLGGSMFSIAPDGSGRELLVSSGSFAPAAEIVKLAPSPRGSFIAFTVNVPGPNGEPIFHSLSLVNIDSGELVRVPVAPEFRVTDLWWTTAGLVWRGVHRGAEVVDTVSEYVGFEPFLIGRFNPDSGESRALFQSTAN